MGDKIKGRLSRPQKSTKDHQIEFQSLQALRVRAYFQVHDVAPQEPNGVHYDCKHVGLVQGHTDRGCESSKVD